MIVTARVIANSWNNRPTTSPMKRSGISTAISDTVSEMMVKPICAEPRRAARSGVSPASMKRADVLDHGRSHRRRRKPVEMVRAISGQIVEAEAEQEHDDQRSDQRQGDREARDEGCRKRPQEDEDDDDHEDHCEAEFEFDIRDRSADRVGAVAQDRDVHCGRKASLELRQKRLDAVRDLNGRWRRVGAVRSG